MSNLSELLPTGGGQNAVNFVASGTLSSGQTVVLKSDGTVEAVAETSVTGFDGSNTTFTSNAIEYPTTSGFDPISGKFLIIYSDKGNSNYPTGVVATVSGTSISFGTPSVLESAQTQTFTVTYDPNATKLVIGWSSGGSAVLKATVATISGTSVSYGTSTTLSGDYVVYLSATYNTTSNNIVYAFQTSSSDGQAVLATVSGSSISFGTRSTFETGSITYTSICYDPNEDCVVIAYKKTSLGGGYGVAVVGTVSGTSLSFGSKYTFNSAVTNFPTIAYDLAQQKALLVYDDVGNSGYATMSVVTVSGTTLTFGSEVTLVSQATSEYMSSVYDSNTGTVLVALNWGSGGAIHSVAISGATPSSSGSYSTGVRSQGSFIALDPSTSNAIISFRNSSSSDIGQAKPFRFGYSSTNYTDFIGITAGAISDTATGTVNVYGGINEAQTGLTIGADYYVQDDGSLSTTSSAVKVGQAISATTINMMDLT